MSSTKTQEKLFYRIDEVSRLTKLDEAVVEAWEKEFSFLQPGVTGEGQKIFRARDVDMIRRVKELLDKKNVTLAGAGRQIEAEFGLKPRPSVHPDKLLKALYQVRDQLHDIAQSLEKKPKKG